MRICRGRRPRGGRGIRITSDVGAADRVVRLTERFAYRRGADRLVHDLRAAGAAAGY